MLDGVEGRELADEFPWGLRQEGQRLHHEATDQYIEDVFAPFLPEDRLVLLLRPESLDGDENQAGEEHVEREPVDDEVDR